MQGRYEYNAMVSYVNAKKAHLPSFDTDDIQVNHQLMKIFCVKDQKKRICF